MDRDTSQSDSDNSFFIRSMTLGIEKLKDKRPAERASQTKSKFRYSSENFAIPKYDPKERSVQSKSNFEFSSSNNNPEINQLYEKIENTEDSAAIIEYTTLIAFLEKSEYRSLVLRGSCLFRTKKLYSC